LLRDAKPPLFGRRRKIVGPRHCKPDQGGRQAARRLRLIAVREGRNAAMPGKTGTATRETFSEFRRAAGRQIGLRRS
jgi:hypothetical protein